MLALLCSGSVSGQPASLPSWDLQQHTTTTPAPAAAASAAAAAARELASTARDAPRSHSAPQTKHSTTRIMQFTGGGGEHT